MNGAEDAPQVPAELSPDDDGIGLVVQTWSLFSAQIRERIVAMARAAIELGAALDAHGCNAEPRSGQATCSQP